MPTMMNRAPLMSANTVIDSAIRVIEFESSETPMSIADIGRRVGAEVVVFLTIDAWTLTRDGSSTAPSARGRIKIIDAVTNNRIFPTQQTGHPLIIRMPTRPGTVPADRAKRAGIEQELAQAIGVELAQVFYKHEIDSMAKRRL